MGVGCLCLLLDGIIYLIEAPLFRLLSEQKAAGERIHMLALVLGYILRILCLCLRHQQLAGCRPDLRLDTPDLMQTSSFNPSDQTVRDYNSDLISKGSPMLLYQQNVLSSSCYPIWVC